MAKAATPPPPPGKGEAAPAAEAEVKVRRVRALKYHLRDPNTDVLIPSSGSVQVPSSTWLDIQLAAGTIQEEAEPAPAAAAEPPKE